MGSEVELRNFDDGENAGDASCPPPACRGLLGSPCPTSQPPSEADIKITRALIRAGQLLKIEVLDHIVIGNPNHSSLRSLGYFYSA
ncbi:MAG: JAB domain-containing protein [Limisphaerales bacterium]